MRPPVIGWLRAGAGVRPTVDMSTDAAGERKRFAATDRAGRALNRDLSGDNCAREKDTA